MENPIIRFHRVASLPSPSSEHLGHLYFNTVDHTINLCNGSGYDTFDGGGNILDAAISEGGLVLTITKKNGSPVELDLGPAFMALYNVCSSLGLIDEVDDILNYNVPVSLWANDELPEELEDLRGATVKQILDLVIQVLLDLGNRVNQDVNNIKVTQSTVSDPSVIDNATSTSFISTISQNPNGEITATKANLPTATSETAGITRVGVSGGAASYDHSHLYAGSSSPGGPASSVHGKLTIGNQEYNGSSNVTITAADLGISSAMHFLGSTTTSLSDGSTTSSITIGGETKTPTTGDVVLSGDNKEFVWTGSKWEVLGDEGSYALKSITVSGDGTYILNGGNTNLSGNITLSHATQSSVSPAKYSPNTSASTSTAGLSLNGGDKFTVPSITVDQAGHITRISDTVISLPSDMYVTSANFTSDTSNSTLHIKRSSGMADVTANLPIAGSDLGVVRTTSAVTTKTSDLIPSPIIGGVVYYKDTNTEAITITTQSQGDDVITLVGSNNGGQPNLVKYTASHKKELGEGRSYTSGNTTTSVSFGTSTIKVPKITVNQYGHVTAAQDQEITISIPSAANNSTITFNYSGGTSDSFTLNQSSPKSIDISDTWVEF